MQNKDSLDLDYQQFKKIDDSCFLFRFCFEFAVTFPEGGFSASLFAADRCLFSQNRSLSSADSQLQQIHQLCTSHLQVASTASLRKRTRPMPSKAVLMSSEPKKEVEMTEISLSTSEETKLLKPVIESLGKSLTSSGDTESKPLMESQKETHTSVRDVNRKRPIRMARIVDYVFCVCFWSFGVMHRAILMKCILDCSL